MAGVGRCGYRIQLVGGKFDIEAFVIQDHENVLQMLTLLESCQETLQVDCVVGVGRLGFRLHLVGGEFDIEANFVIQDLKNKSSRDMPKNSTGQFAERIEKGWEYKLEVSWRPARDRLWNITSVFWGWRMGLLCLGDGCSWVWILAKKFASRPALWYGTSWMSLRC